MSGLPEHVDEAAVWLGVHWFEAKRPLIPNLRRRFPKLTTKEAIEAMRIASEMQHKGGAHVDAS